MALLTNQRATKRLPTNQRAVSKHHFEIPSEACECGCKLSKIFLQPRDVKQLQAVECSYMQLHEFLLKISYEENSKIYSEMEYNELNVG